MFSLISKVSVCFFPVVENVLTQIHIQFAPRREFVIWTLGCIFIKKKDFTDHRQSDSVRNNIHPNNKQKPEITNKNTMASQAECETCFQANILIFTFIFRCSG